MTLRKIGKHLGFSYKGMKELTVWTPTNIVRQSERVCRLLFTDNKPFRS